MKNDLVLTPKIDYTKEDVILVTPAGVEHCNSVTPSEHAVKVKQDYRSSGFCTTFTKDYIAINPYTVTGTVYQVKAFKEKQDAKIVPLNAIQQIRIYKNRKVVMLCQSFNEEGEAIEGASVFLSKDYSIKNNDEAVAAAATILKGELKKQFKYALQGLTEFDQEKPELRIVWCSWSTWFQKETLQKINEFLGLNEDNLIVSSFKEKSGHNEIMSLEDLISFLSISVKVEDSKKKKIANMQSIIDLFEEYPEVAAVTAGKEDPTYWWLRKDNIIALYTKTALFVYNTETQKRGLYVKKRYRETWGNLVPSITNIKHNFTTETYVSYRDLENHLRSKYIIIPSKILGGITQKELFKGTNMEWILENVKDDELIVANSIVPKNNISEYYGNAEIKPIKEFFTATYVSPLAISVLATTGDHLLELLLKAKLFNLYLVKLADIGSSCKTIEVKSPGGYNGYNTSLLIYNEKGKNLQEIFGMPLSFLRIIDDVGKIIAEGGDSRKYFSRKIPHLGVFPEVLDIAKLDKNMFKDLIDFLVDHISSRDSWSTNKVGWDAIKNIVESLELKDNKQIMDLIKRYGFCAETYRDYLRSRKALKEIQDKELKKYYDEGVENQERLNQIKEIFSKRQYPEKPEKARRFFNILEEREEGDKAPRAYYGNSAWVGNYRIENWDYYHYLGTIQREGDFEVVRDEKDRAIGVIAQLTPTENMFFLHDLAARWVSLFSDAAKAERFLDAVTRVQELEWEDKELGLKIIAPENLGALNREGSVLSHCVASYADSIINGTENIMFLRRTDMPDDPYYTVEILPGGEIRQVHCYHNGSLKPEAQRTAYIDSGYKCYNKIFDIVKFLKKWAGAMNEKVKASSIRDTYKALCALRY